MFNFAEVLGTTSSSIVEGSVHPEWEKGAGAAAGRIAISIGSDAAWNLMTEFLPDVARHLNPRWMLLRRLADFPDEVALAAREFAPHQLTFYLKDLAQEFHSYYNAERFLVDDPRIRNARLALIVAVGQVLRNGLTLLGIGAPDAM